MPRQQPKRSTRSGKRWKGPSRRPDKPSPEQKAETGEQIDKENDDPNAGGVSAKLLHAEDKPNARKPGSTLNKKTGKLKTKRPPADPNGKCPYKPSTTIGQSQATGTGGQDPQGAHATQAERRITIVAGNIRKLATDRIQIDSFLQLMSEGGVKGLPHRVIPDVISISETDFRITIPYARPGYEAFRHEVSDMTNGKIRALMYVKPELKPEQIQVPGCADIAVVCVRSEEERRLFITYYRTWGKGKGQVRHEQEIEEAKRFVKAMTEILQDQCLGGNGKRGLLPVMTGDTNCDFDKDHACCDQVKEILADFLNLFNMVRAIYNLEKDNEFFTFQQTNGSRGRSCPDNVFYFSGDDITMTLLDLIAELSDHKWMVIGAISLKEVRPEKSSKQRPLKKLNYKKTNYNTLINRLGDQEDWLTFNEMAAHSQSDANDLVNTFTRNMLDAIEISTPLVRNKNKTAYHTFTLSTATRQLMRLRDWSRNFDKANYKERRNLAKKSINKDKMQSRVDRIRGRNGPTEAWRISQEILGKKKGNALPLINEAKNDEQAADAANKFLVQKIDKIRERIRIVHLPKPPGQVPEMFDLAPVTISQVKEAIKDLASTTAVGVDKIPITTLKNVKQFVVGPIAAIANTIIKTGTWPDEWKLATIIPILKAGKPKNEASSYRPVALLNATSKVVEKVISRQITSFAERWKWLPSEQHGFRQRRGIDTALANLVTEAAAGMDKKQKITISAFDYSAAFDTVDPKVLVERLHWMSDQARKLILSYLTGRRQRVKWNEAISGTREVKFGVPQGSVLGPLLFTLLTANMPDAVRGESSLTVYADDTTSLVSAKTWTQVTERKTEVEDNMVAYAGASGLCLNLDKTQFLDIGQGATDKHPLKILGTTIDHDLTFKTHNEALLVDLKRRNGMIYRLRTELPRGTLLKAIAEALVVGKARSALWITWPVQLSDSNDAPLSATEKAMQVEINDLARILINKKRKHRIKIKDLLKRANLPSLNEIAIIQAATAAFKAIKLKNPALRDCLIIPEENPDRTTRATAAGLVRPASTRSIPALNMARVWNKFESIRAEDSLERVKEWARLEARRLEDRLTFSEKTTIDYHYAIEALTKNRASLESQNTL